MVLRGEHGLLVWPLQGRVVDRGLAWARVLDGTLLRRRRLPLLIHLYFYLAWPFLLTLLTLPYASFDVIEWFVDFGDG